MLFHISIWQLISTFDTPSRRVSYVKQLIFNWHK